MHFTCNQLIIQVHVYTVPKRKDISDEATIDVGRVIRSFPKNLQSVTVQRLFTSGNH